MTTGFPTLRSVRKGSYEQTIFAYSLFKANRRLVLDIHHQDPALIYHGADYGEYFYYKTPNGYEIMSHSRMYIYTKRIWVVGAKPHLHSGSLILSSNEKRDKIAGEIHLAIFQWMASIDPGNKLSWRSNYTAGLQETEYFLRLDESAAYSPAAKWSFDSDKWGSGGSSGNGR